MKTVAVGIDFTDKTDAVLRASVELAKAAGLELHLVHIYAAEPEFVGYATYAYPGIDEREEELQAEKASIREMVSRVQAEGITAHGYMKEGETVRGLIDFAEHRKSDLIVVGNHGRGAVGRFLLGSVSEGVVRHSEIPVLVVPCGPFDKDS